MLEETEWEVLVGSIYETSVFPERWPLVLDKLAHHVGAKGGNLIRSTADTINLVPSPAIVADTVEFDRQGWNQYNTRVGRLLERGSYPGFLTDSHLHSEEELRTLPMYTEFLNPRGAAAGAGTLIQGARDDGMVIAIEAFSSHEASREAVPELDKLRPHLARAAVLSSQIQNERAAMVIGAFEAVGSAIALLDPSGKAVAMSHRFAAETAGLLSDGPARLRMHDPETDRRFALALKALDRHKSGMSIALRDEEGVGAAVLHLIPARHDARELFSKVTIFAVLARPGNDLLPSADIIAALFDLTPAEARVARAIAQGQSPTDVAHNANLSPETVRSQLKRVFAKTSTRRQGELAALLSRLG